MLELLPHLCYTADAVTRDDLIQDLLVDERAYIASWMARTRDLWRLAGFSSATVVRQPTQNFEMTYGVDAIIAINLSGLWKFLAVEAKRPGFGHARPWDRVQSVKGPKPPWSRFSRQIMKQSLLAKYGWSVGGLFIDERPHYSAGYDPLACSFISNDILVNHLPSKKVPPGKPGKGWTTKEIVSLLGHSGNPHPGNIRDALELLIQCAVGEPMTTSQTREMTESLEESLGDPVPMERDYIPAQLDRLGDDSITYEIGRQMVSIDLTGAPRPQPMSEEAEIIRQLVEATGAAHGLVLTVPEARQDNQLMGRWREKNMRFRPEW